MISDMVAIEIFGLKPRLCWKMKGAMHTDLSPATLTFELMALKSTKHINQLWCRCVIWKSNSLLLSFGVDTYLPFVPKGDHDIWALNQDKPCNTVWGWFVINVKQLFGNKIMV